MRSTSLTHDEEHAHFIMPLWLQKMK